MKTHRTSVSSEFETGIWKRESMFAARNRTYSTSKTSCADQEQKAVRVRDQRRKINHVFALFAVSISALWVASCQSGKMMMSTTNKLSRARILQPYSGRPPLQLFFPNPLLVSASKVPSVVPRFHSNRIGNGLPSFRSPLITEPSHLLDIHRYRGGSQNRQRRWHSIKLDDIDRDDEEERDPKPNNNPLARLNRSQQRVTKVVRQGAGAMFSFVGFVGSSAASLVTDRRSFEDRFLEPIRALRIYLKTSG